MSLLNRVSSGNLDFDDEDFEGAEILKDFVDNDDSSLRKLLGNMEQEKDNSLEGTETEEEPIEFISTSEGTGELEDDEEDNDTSAMVPESSNIPTNDTVIGKEDTGDAESYGGKISKVQGIIVAVLIVGVILALVIWVFGLIFPDEKKPKPTEGTSPESQSTAVVPPTPQAPPAPTTVTVAYDAIPKLHEEYLTIPDAYFSDKMIVSKYVSVVDNAATCYFMGIPENFKQKIIFAVSPNTYNQVANGAYISIDYKIINVDGKDFVFDVISNVGGV